VLNPTDVAVDAVVRLGVPFSSARACRLDETETDDVVDVSAGALRFPIGAHALRTVKIVP